MTGNRKYKTKLKHAQVQAIHDLIETIIKEVKPRNDAEKLLQANLFEVKTKLYNRMGLYQKEYTITFPAAQSMALRMLFTCYVNDTRTYVGNCLHTIANNVDKLSA